VDFVKNELIENIFEQCFGVLAEKQKLEQKRKTWRL